jgi:hypothetical protein
LLQRLFLQHQQQQSVAMMKSQFDLNTSMSAWSNEIDLELKKKNHNNQN